MRSGCRTSRFAHRDPVLVPRHRRRAARRRPGLEAVPGVRDGLGKPVGAAHHLVAKQRAWLHRLLRTRHPPCPVRARPRHRARSLRSCIGGAGQCVAAAVRSAAGGAGRRADAARTGKPFRPALGRAAGRASGRPSPRQFGRNWVERLALRVHEWRDTSARQVERRVKSFSGRSLRQWQALVRATGMFFAARDRYEKRPAFRLGHAGESATLAGVSAHRKDTPETRCAADRSSLDTWAEDRPT